MSAVTAAVLSYQSIKTNRDISRRRATLDMIEKSESTQYYQEMASCFSELRKAGDGFRQIQNPINSEIKRQRSKVIGFLNHYELIAIGCAKGILDEEPAKVTCAARLCETGKPLSRSWNICAGRNRLTSRQSHTQKPSLRISKHWP